MDGFKGVLPGSVSKYCLQHSPVPVVVVRPSQKRQKKKAKREADPTRRSYRDLLSVDDGSEDVTVYDNQATNKLIIPKLPHYLQPSRPQTREPSVERDPRTDDDHLHHNNHPRRRSRSPFANLSIDLSRLNYWSANSSGTDIQSN
jgi:hypothetical protein